MPSIQSGELTPRRAAMRSPLSSPLARTCTSHALKWDSATPVLVSENDRFRTHHMVVQHLSGVLDYDFPMTQESLYHWQEHLNMRRVGSSPALPATTFRGFSGPPSTGIRQQPRHKPVLLTLELLTKKEAFHPAKTLPPALARTSRSGWEGPAMAHVPMSPLKPFGCYKPPPGGGGAGTTLSSPPPSPGGSMRMGGSRELSQSQASGFSMPFE